MKRTDVLIIEMGIKPIEGGASIDFTGGLLGRMGDIVNEEEMAKLQELIGEVSNILHDAVLRDMKVDGIELKIEEIRREVDVEKLNKERQMEDVKKAMEELNEFGSFLKSEKERLYNEATPEQKKQIDDFEKEFENIPDDEKEDFLLAKLEEEIRKAGK